MSDDRIYLDFSTKELTVNNDIRYKDDIKKIQDKLISFCMNMGLFQKSKNMYDLNFSEQLKFNECVDSLVNKLQSDISELESFYASCKGNCLKENPDIEDNIEDYIKKGGWVLQPDLHPCVEDCTSLFKKMYNRYVKYMTKDNGIYYEFIDYNTKLI